MEIEENFDINEFYNSIKILNIDELKILRTYIQNNRGIAWKQQRKIPSHWNSNKKTYSFNNEHDELHFWFWDNQIKIYERKLSIVNDVIKIINKFGENYLLSYVYNKTFYK